MGERSMNKNEKRMIDLMIEEITRAIKDNSSKADDKKLLEWVGNLEIQDYLVNKNSQHPMKGFVTEAIAIRDPFIYTLSIISGEQTHGTLLISSISSITSTLSKERAIQFQIIMESGLVFKMYLLPESWEKMLQFKMKVEKLIEDKRRIFT
jgi:hypothetical protein